MSRVNSINRRIFLAMAIVAVVVPVVAYSTLSGSANRNLQRVVPARLEVELITLRPPGCEPAELIRPKGPFALMIDDRSGKENSSLDLRPESGERVRAINLNRRKSEWYSVVDLPPNRYVLQDPNDPEWRCQITILP